MKVEILRCWKSKLNNKINGEYYVYDSGGSKHFVFQNNNEIKVIEHFSGGIIKECVVEPTQKVIDAIYEASEKYLSTCDKEIKNASSD